MVSNYPDNLPATLNIGQGSPTNVMFGTGAKFPEKYQKALYAFDWSFGIIYASALPHPAQLIQPQPRNLFQVHHSPLTDGQSALMEQCIL
jgi:hypothetical protein